VIEGSFSARLTAETVQSNYSVDCRLTDAFVASDFINTLKNSWRAGTRRWQYARHSAPVVEQAASNTNNDATAVQYNINNSVCVQPPTYAGNVPLPAHSPAKRRRCCAPVARVQRSIDISCRPGPQQQTCSSNPYKPDIRCQQGTRMRRKL